MLKKGSVLIAVALALLAFAAAADARTYIAIDNVRSQPETLDGQPGSLSFDFTESGLRPGSESTYCSSAWATVTTLGREFRPSSHGGRWFATMRRVTQYSGSIRDYFRGNLGACTYTAVADATGTAHGHLTSEWPHLRILPFLAQWTVSGIWVRDVTHTVDAFAGCPTTLSHYGSNGCDGGIYRTYCNGFRTQFVETGAVPDLAECSAARVGGGLGPGYEHPQPSPRVIAADDGAKAAARAMRDQIESCHTRTNDYSACPAQITPESSGLPIGSGRGQVEITDARPPGAGYPMYTIVAHSRSGTDFTLALAPRWPWVTPFVQTCNRPNRGECSWDGEWD